MAYILYMGSAHRAAKREMKMRALSQIHSQDLSDVLSAARTMFAENKTQTDVHMFRASFGGLFCEEGAAFNEKLDACDANKNQIPEVLGMVAVELEARLAN